MNIEKTREKAKVLEHLSDDDIVLFPEGDIWETSIGRFQAFFHDEEQEFSDNWDGIPRQVNTRKFGKLFLYKQI